MITMIMLALLRAPLVYVLRGAGDFLVRSVGGGFWKAGVSLKDSFGNDNGTLRKKVSELEAERDRLIVENAKLKGMDVENRRLSALLEFVGGAEYDLRVVDIVGGSTDLDMHTVEIDAGSSDGVVIDDAVVAGEGAVVGKVVSVRERGATVELLTDSRSRFATLVLSSDGQATGGVAEGGHGTGMMMRLIPQNAPIMQGDTVVTSGLESGIPRGLLVGRVESVREEPNEPFQTAVLSPIVSLDSLTTVGVVMAPR